MTVDPTQLLVRLGLIKNGLLTAQPPVQLAAVDPVQAAAASVMRQTEGAQGSVSQPLSPEWGSVVSMAKEDYNAKKIWPKRVIATGGGGGGGGGNQSGGAGGNHGGSGGNPDPPPGSGARPKRPRRHTSRAGQSHAIGGSIGAV